MKKARTVDEGIEGSTNVNGHKQPMDSLSASSSECAGADLLSSGADIALTARELDGRMKTKLTKTTEKAELTLPAVVAVEEMTRALTPLATYLEIPIPT